MRLSYLRDGSHSPDADMGVVEKLLEPVSPELPCGVDLEYEPVFARLETLARGKPEQQVGSSIIAAEPPDWPNVKAEAEALFTRTKDLRIAVHLAKALLHTGGLIAFADGLAVLHGLIARYWDGVHPGLDPDDGEATMRVNALAGLCHQATVLSPIRATPLVSVAAIGRFSLRDIAMAEGETPPDPGRTPPKLAEIEAAFDACPAGDIERTSEAMRGAASHLQDIEATVTDRVGAGQSLSLSKLRTLLEEIAAVMEERLVRRTAATAENEAATLDEHTPEPRAARQPGNGSSGAITSREDVVNALERICQYYAQFEPSSPVPILLRRSQRLVHMTFLDIVRDIAPDAVNQVEILRGRDPNQGNG